MYLTDLHVLLLHRQQKHHSHWTSQSFQSYFGKLVLDLGIWTLTPSHFHPLTAFSPHQLVYRHFESACGDVNMVDEVRRVAPGLCLSIGTWGFTKGQRLIQLLFVLESPVAPYRGEIGQAR